jgi:malonyl-CoA O-methyltransferase
LEPDLIRENFDRLAESYDSHAALEQEVATRLLERTVFNRLAPSRILDLGCGTGTASAALKSQFRQAQVIGLDSSPLMLEQLKHKSRLFKPLKAICADATALPLAAQSVDMVFSSLVNHLLDDAALFTEMRRVLRPEGMLMFATLGPQSLAELGSAWGGLDETVQLTVFPDLMELGDALFAAGFREPVMDTERITLQYPDLKSMMLELEATGASLLISGWEKWESAYEQLADGFEALLVDGKYPITFEIVYGMAFGPPESQPRKTDQGDIVTISVDSLLKSRPMGYD